ncbi:MAG TPA: CdaR family protein [Terriglobales bacterium]|nr:CdaR family protein [Terriglobales bacterium]
MADFLRQYVFANFGYKVVSLALAVGLWWAISHDPVAAVGLTVPIEFHNIPSNLEISSLNIPEAQVRVRGPERLIHELRPQEVHVEVDLAGVKPGERTFDLTAQQVRQPRDLQVVQIVPSQVRLSFDIGLARQVEVRPRVIGTFAAGYRIAKLFADPATVSITGPKQRVEAVEAATTDPVDASGTMERGTFVVNAFVSDPLVQIVRPAPVRVTVLMEKINAEPAPQGTKRPE